MVDHEARGRTQAVRTQPRVVAVAREHEDVHPLGGGHHLALDAPAAALGGDLAPETLARLGQQRLSGFVGDGAQRRVGAGRRRAPAAGNAAASATVASQVSSTIQTSARISGQALRAEP
jgi:hypothetical protein